jgi:hypothetical protein
MHARPRLAADPQRGQVVLVSHSWAQIDALSMKSGTALGPLHKDLDIR